MSPRARQAKGKARLNAYEELLREDTAQKIETAEIYIAPGPAARRHRRRSARRAEGLRRQPADRRPRLHAAARRHRRRHRPERRRQDDAVPDDHRAGEARRRHAAGSARRCRSATSIRAATRSTRTRRVFDEITGGDDEIELGKRKVASRAYVSWFNFKGAAQQRKVGTLSGGERNRVHLAKLLKKGQQPAAARRADQRPRRRHAAGARGGAAQLRRLRRGHQPRSLVPRPHRHAHARVRRRQPGGVVRGELSGLRGRPQAPPRRGGRPAAPDQVPEADAVAVGRGASVGPRSMTNTIAIRTAAADDVPRIVALLNAAFAMERDFINRDRTSAPEIETLHGDRHVLRRRRRGRRARVVHVSRATRRSPVSGDACRQAGPAGARRSGVR